MADLRISALPVLLAADAEATDDIAVADYSSSETRRLTLKGAVQKGVTLIDDGVLPGAKLAANSVTAAQIAANAITASELADNSVDTAAIVDLAVTNSKIAAGVDGAKLIADSVTAAQIGPNAITASELADDAVDTAAVQDAAITNIKLATGIDGAKLVDASVTDAKLAAGIDGAKLVTDSVTAVQIAPNAITASELADNAVDTAAIAAGAVTDNKLATGIDGAKLTDATVTNDKLATGIDGAKLVADSVTAAQIAADAITASELADNAVDTSAVVNGAITDDKLASGISGSKLAADSVTAAQIAPNAITASELADGGVDTAAVQDAAITDAKLASGIDGSKLSDDTVTAAKIPAASLDRGLDKTSGAIGHTNVITAATRSGITFDGQGHITAHTALISTDLPVATPTEIGAVNVPATGGLSVSGIGALEHTNSVAPAKASGITYDAHGHIVSVAPLVGTDLPDATATSKGAVMVPNLPLQVTGGALTHADSTVLPGVYPKVTVDAKGHVTAGAGLAVVDIPNLDASKINTGTFTTDQIADGSITRAKLADYAIAYIQEAIPPLTGVPIGELWYQESTAGLHMWNGNSWMPISIGRLSQENLRYCGLIDASTGLVTGVTSFGTAASYKIGDALRAATDADTGVYFVVETAGNGIGVTTGITYDPGDWVLCSGHTAGWQRIDTLSSGGGGGGGGGVARLNDLLDVTLTSPAVGQVLVYNTTGQWVNTGVLSGGTY